MKAFLMSIGRLMAAFWLRSLVLAVLLCGWLWWVGPRVALDDWRPWQAPAARLLSIALIAFVWAGLMLLQQWRELRHRSKAPDSAAARGYVRKRAQQASTSEMRQRFKAARQRLMRGTLYRGRSGYWRKSLPWYLLLGAPGSGKTSVLEYSGLPLPLNPRDDRMARPPAATTSVDWYFAEHGVVLDTPGTLLTQPDTQAAQHWQALLTVLRRQRRARPLNGVVACLPVSTLLDADEAPLQAFASHLNTRVAEIREQLRCSVPVYLLLTQADELRGFDAFFDSLTSDDKRQALGIALKPGERQLDHTLLSEKFTALARHLHSQLILRVHGEHEGKRLARMVTFPQRLKSLVNPLRQLLDSTFTGNRYQAAVPLMGVYLTAAPYWRAKTENSPSAKPAAATPAKVDADAGAGTGADAETKNQPSAQEQKPAAPTPSGKKTSRKSRTDDGRVRLSGSARFIEQVFSGAVFAHSGLARLDRDEARRLTLLQGGKVVGLLAVFSLFTGTWAYAWRDSAAAMETLRGLGGSLNEARKTSVASDDPLTLLPRLDSSYAATEVFSAAPFASWFHHTGLYQGDETDPALQQVYQSELDRHLLPAIARMLARDVRSQLNDRDALLQSLRLYLMLDDLSHRDKRQLRDHLLSRWNALYPNQQGERSRLSVHLDRLLDQPFAYPLEQKLVSQARMILQSSGDAQVMYETLKQQARGLDDYRFNRHLDRHGLLFSGTDQAIPGLYTRAGYEHYLLGKGRTLVEQSLRDNWAMGRPELPDPVRVRQLMVELENLYLHDYADHWSSALGSVALLPLENAAQGAEYASALTAPDSPLIKLLNEVRDNTRLTLPQTTAVDTPQVPGIAGQWVKAATAVLPAPLPDRARRLLAQRFANLHRLLADDGGPAPDLIAALQALNSLHLQLGTLAVASQPQEAAFELAKGRMAGQLDGINALRLASNRLPMPVSNWLRPLADDSWSRVLEDAYRHVNQRYRDEVLAPYDKAIARRYPFNPRSESDVALLDFQEFFKPDGLADAFFDRYLKPFVSGSPGDYRLRATDGRSLPVSPNTLKQLGKVQGIQRSFFAESPEQAGLTFRLAPYSLDATVSRSTFRLGSTRLEYRHGPIIPTTFTWPGSSDSYGASLVTERADGRAIGFEENTGPWSLFRLLDRMETEPHHGRDVMMVKAEIAGARVNYLLSNRVPNAFDMQELRSFALPMAL